MMHMRALLDEWVDRKAILGAQVFHQHHGESHVVVAGESAPGIDATAGTVSRIYCGNKPVLAVAVGVAVQEGLLDLHDPVTRFFDDCAPPLADVTVAGLLGHTVTLPPLCTGRATLWQNAPFALSLPVAV